jgi:hypothetical protein
MAVNDIVMGAAGASGPATYIEDVFSTWLYTGTGTPSGSPQTITNGIDLASKGGLVWIKKRQDAPHALFDTTRGPNNYLSSSATIAQNGYGVFTDTLTSFNSNGFSLGLDSSAAFVNDKPGNYASWTFRKQPKFFDVVTYTGTGANTTIPHNLGSAPGCIIVKRTDTAGFSWPVYHVGTGNANRTLLNETFQSGSAPTFWNSTTPTSTVFSVGTNVNVNASGGTYVAYLFAHNAGGFGLSGTDNVISCGSYTGSSTVDVDVNLGYEPQFVMIKNITTGSTDWYIADIMRGMALTGIQPLLAPNLSGAETGFSGTYFTPTATGMKVQYGSGTAICSAGNNYIYIAIRRPMKTPTTGTEVFNPNTSFSAISSGVFGVTTGFPVDALWWRRSNVASSTNYLNGFMTRLQGSNNLQPYSTAAEANYLSPKFDYNTQVAQQAENAGSQIYWSIKRAPGFFDVVCWTKSMVTDVVNHNLTVIPELIISKCRSRAGTYWDIMPNVAPYSWQYNLYLPLTNSVDGPSPTYWGAAPTSTQFSKRYTSGESNGDTFVAYLFATVAGVSKVGSYTGNGSSQTINCGFTTGARFIMIKCTSATGDWKVIDSARGIVAGNDPTLALNTTAAEVTGTDCIDPDSSGFIVNQETTNNLNVNGDSYIFLSIA